MKNDNLIEQTGEISAWVKAFLSETKDIIFIKNTALVYIAASETFAKTVGYCSASELIGKTTHEIISDYVVADRWDADERRVLEFAGMETGIESLYSMDGTARVYEITRSVLRDGDGNIIGIYVVCRDITKQRNAQLAYERDLLLQMKIMPDMCAVMLFDVTDWAIERMYFRDDEMRDLLQHHSISEYLRAAVDSVVDDENVRSYFASITPESARSMYDTERHEFSFEYFRKMQGGVKRWIREEIRYLTDPSTNHIMISFCIKDIDAEKKQVEELVLAAETDTMTGLYNHDAMIVHVDKFLHGEGRNGFHALLMVDIDNFKSINDKMGHQIGDNAIVNIAQAIKSTFRKSDLMGRVGGDEFLILMKDITDPEFIRHKAQELITALQFTVSSGISTLELTASVGIALYNTGHRSTGELYTNADTALYAAKREGKNRYCVFGEKKVFVEPDVQNDLSTKTHTIQYRMMLENMDACVIIAEVSVYNDPPEIKIVYTSPSTFKRLHTSREELGYNGEGLMALINPDDVSAMRDAIFEAVRNKSALDYSFRVDTKMCKNGNCEWWHMRAVLLPPENDGIDRIICVLTDISLLKTVNEKLSNAVLTRFVALEYEFLGTIDVKTGMMTEIYCYDNSVLYPPRSGMYYPYEYKRAMEALIDGDYLSESIENMSIEHIVSELKKTSSIYTLTYPVRVSNGELIYKKWQYTWLDNQKQRIAYTRGDVTDEYQAQHDTLTGLYNRKAFVKFSQKRLEETPANSYVLYCIDINNFKVINDHFGHDEGDRVLRYIGDCIQRNVQIKIGGLVCRDVADTFLALCPNDLNMLNRLYSRGMTEINNLNFKKNISLRIGKYVVSDPTLDVNLMIDHAMLAQRSIKERINTHIALYNESMREKILREQELIGDMSRALEAGQFKVWFQPQYDYDSGSMIGAEALVRWKHPEHGMISPAEFIPLFERNGLITKLDKYVYERSCRCLREWDDDGPCARISISVNISRIDLYDTSLCDSLIALLDKYGLDRSRLRLEITESAYMNDPEQLKTAVIKMRELGFTVEMDDFGSGYSSLNMLKEIPVDTLKLDMRFLSTDDEMRGGCILSSIIRMAHWLKLSVIAEGVETKAQAEYLKSLNCSLMQGYYFARPMSCGDFAKLLKSAAVGSCDDYKNITIEGVGEFWNPSAQMALLFNSFVGGAAIMEYHNGNIEIMRANDNFFHEMGVSRAEFSHRNAAIADEFDAENLSIFRGMFEEAASTGKEAECTVRSLPGYCGWTHNRARLLAKNNDIMLYYIAVENVTIQKEVEERLRETGEELQLAISQTGKTVCRYDILAHTLYMPKQYAEKHSIAEVLDRIPERELTEIIPADREIYRSFYNRILNGETDCTVQFRVNNSNGGYSWELCKSSIVYDDAGNPRYAVLTVEDITAEKNQEAINECNRLLIDYTGICIFDYDVESDALHFETNAKDRGHIRRDFKNYISYFVMNTEYVHPDYRRLLCDRITEAIKKPTVDKLEYIADNWLTGYRWSRMHYASLADESGKVYRIVGQIYDIQSEKERKIFVENLNSHIYTYNENLNPMQYNYPIVNSAFRLLYSSADISHAVRTLIATLGEHYKVDRVFIYEESADRRFSSNTYEWNAQGQILNMSDRWNIPIEYKDGIPLYQIVFDENGLLRCNDTENIDGDLRRIVVPYGSQSTLQYLIEHGGVPCGVIGYNQCETKRVWEDETVDTLEIISKLIGIFLEIKCYRRHRG